MRKVTVDRGSMRTSLRSILCGYQISSQDNERGNSRKRCLVHIFKILLYQHRENIEKIIEIRKGSHQDLRCNIVPKHRTDKDPASCFRGKKIYCAAVSLERCYSWQ